MGQGEHPERGPNRQTPVTKIQGSPSASLGMAPPTSPRAALSALSLCIHTRALLAASHCTPVSAPPSPSRSALSLRGADPSPGLYSHQPTDPYVLRSHLPPHLDLSAPSSELQCSLHTSSGPLCGSSDPGL